MLTHPISINAFEYFKLGCGRKKKTLRHVSITVSACSFQQLNFDIFKTKAAFAKVLHVCTFMQYPKQ